MKKFLFVLSWWFIIEASHPIQVGHWFSEQKCEAVRRMVKLYNTTKCFEKFV